VWHSQQALNCHIWESENPHDITEYEHNLLKANVQCTLTKNKVINLFFFFEEPMVTGDTFLVMMNTTTLCYVPVGTIFQLDGIPSHFSHYVLAFIDREFPYHWIGRQGPFSGPTHSPYLTPLD
jgi:hypothetical protein